MGKSIWTIPELLKAFGEEMLHPLERYGEEVRQQFFVQRVTEARQLEAQIGQVEAFGGNLLLVGDPGTGKSSFINWFLKKSNFVNSAEPCTHTVDLKSAGGSIDKDMFMLQCRLRLTDAAKQFISAKYDNPCHDIPASSEIGSPEQAAVMYDRASQLIMSLPRNGPKLYLFVDDIDYIDQSLFPLITSHLKPFLMSPSSCVILAVRRPAENSLRRDDFMIGQFFDKTTISLSHLEILSLVGARVDACIENPRKGIKRLAAQVGAFWEQIRDLLDKDHSRKLEVTVGNTPFTSKQLTLIQDCSNGNIREMLAMCRAYLKFMAAHGNELQRDPYGRVIVGRSALIEELANNPGFDGLPLHDLHERRSNYDLTKAERRRRGIEKQHVGNSLYVLLLETLRDFQSLNATQLGRLTEFGFSADELKEGVRELYSLGMIEEDLLADQRALGERAELGRDYCLTRRGTYYVDYLIHWDEYIAKYGRSRHHETGTAANANEFLLRSLLQFLAAIGTVINSDDDRFDGSRLGKVSKNEFYNAFCKLGEECLIWANWNDKTSPVEIDVQRIEEMLLSLKVIRGYKLADSNTFLIDFEKVTRELQDRSIALEIAVPFFDESIGEFVGSHMFPVDAITKKNRRLDAE